MDKISLINMIIFMCIIYLYFIRWTIMILELNTRYKIESITTNYGILPNESE